MYEDRKLSIPETVGARGSCRRSGLKGSIYEDNEGEEWCQLQGSGDGRVSRVQSVKAGAALICMVVLLGGCYGRILTSAPPRGPGQSGELQTERQCGTTEASVIYSLPRGFVPLSIAFGTAVFQPSIDQKTKLAELSKDIKELEVALGSTSEAEQPVKVEALRRRIKEKKEEVEKLKREATKQGFSAEAGAPILYPDPSRTYALCYEKSAWADDKQIKVKTSANGLLQEISTRSEDRGDDVVRAFGDTIVEVARLSAVSGLPLVGLPLADLPREQAKNCGKKDFQVHVLLDPTEPGRAQEVIDAALAQYDVDAGCVRFTSGMVPATSGRKHVAHTEQETDELCAYGACYRRATPEFFTIVEISTGSGASFLAMLPNGGPIGTVEFFRAAFVEVEGTATFVDGMLTEVRYVKPSSALAVATLPGDVLKSIISIPRSMFETETGAIEANAKLLEAEGRVWEARRTAALIAETGELKNRNALLQIEEETRKLLESRNVRMTPEAIAIKNEIGLLELEQRRRELSEDVRGESAQGELERLQLQVEILRLEKEIAELRGER